MIKKVSWGLFLALLLLISSLFFILKTNATDSQGKDIEDIIAENFNNGHLIEIWLQSAEKPIASFRKADESTISIDKGKGEIRFERRGYEWIFRVSDIRLLHVTQFGSVTIYL